MSTSSDNQTPKLNGESADEVISCDWHEFSALVAEKTSTEFAEWLDDELLKLEAELDEFVTSRSRYSGRR